MARFEWREFFERHGIPYSVGAPHGAGQLGIVCPFCGDAGTDPSRHRMGIHPERGWKCLRDDAHRGRSPVRLVAALLKCSYDEAAQACGIGAAELPPMSVEGIEAALKQTFSPAPQGAPARVELLYFPEEIARLDDPASRERRILLPYVERRGYTRQETWEVARLYGLRGALCGAFAYRVVFPVESAAGLESWTGRAVNAAMVPKYKSLSTDPEKCRRERLPAATLSVKQCLWNEAELLDGGELLLVCEGPMDALRVDYLGHRAGVRATCLFGKAMSKSQEVRLARLAARFKRVGLMLDTDAEFDAVRMRDRLDDLGVDLLSVPRRMKDPALLERGDVEALARR